MPHPSRPSWDDYFIHIAFGVAERSTCDRVHVGGDCAGSAHSGPPAGTPRVWPIATRWATCSSIGHCAHPPRGAERHHPGRAARVNTVVRRSTSPPCPCLTCAKMIINAGIRRWRHAWHYPDENSRRFLGPKLGSLWNICLASGPPTPFINRRAGIGRPGNGDGIGTRFPVPSP